MRAEAFRRRRHHGPAPPGPAARKLPSTTEHRRAPCGPRPPVRPSGSSPDLHLTNQEELPTSQLQKLRPGPARRQPMGGLALRPVCAARAEPAQSEKSEPNPSGPPLRTHRLPPRAARRRLLPPDRVYCPNPKVQFCGPAAASERDDTGVRQVSEARARVRPGPGGHRTCRRDGAGSGSCEAGLGGARRGGTPGLPSEGSRTPRSWPRGDGWTPGSLLSPAELPEREI